MSITTKVGTIHYDALLSNYAADYMSQQNKFITKELLPAVIVNKQGDKYAKFSSKGLFDVKNDLRAKGTEAEMIDTLFMSSDSYYCDERALKEKIYLQDIINADAIVQEEKRKTFRLVNALLLSQEYRAASLVFTAANYSSTSKATIAAADQWSLNDYATNDPQKQIRDYAYTICNRSGLTYSDLTVVISDETMNGLRRSPFIQNYMASTVAKNIDANVLAGYFGVGKVLIGAASYNTAKEGQTVSVSGMWGKNALICYTQAGATMEDPSFAKTFLWNGVGNAATQDRGIVGVRKWYDENTKTNYIESELNYDQKIVFEDVAYLLSEVIA